MIGAVDQWSEESLAMIRVEGVSRSKNCTTETTKTSEQNLL